MQVDSKATLGLGGVAVVLGAVIAAMGFYSYLRVPSSLVIIQVVPFLVLAVGADNIFIFVLEYQVRKEGLFIPSGNTTPSLDKAQHRGADILADSSIQAYTCRKWCGLTQIYSHYLLMEVFILPGPAAIQSPNRGLY